MDEHPPWWLALVSVVVSPADYFPSSANAAIEELASAYLAEGIVGGFALAGRVLSPTLDDTVDGQTTTVSQAGSDLWEDVVDNAAFTIAGFDVSVFDVLASVGTRVGPTIGTTAVNKRLATARREPERGG